MINEVGGDIDKIKDSQGNTPLHYLCQQDTLTAQSFQAYLEILLRVWTIDVPNNSNRTPLHTAIESRRPRNIILYLLEKKLVITNNRVASSRSIFN